MTTRLLLAATAIVACVAPLVAGSVTAASDRPLPTTASNRHVAQRDAANLLQRLHLPPAAVRSPTEPSGDGGHLKPVPLLNATSAAVDQHDWWQVPGSPSAVLAYVKSHRLSGSKFDGSGGLYHSGALVDRSLTFEWPPVRGVLGERELTVTLIALPGGETGVLAQAQSNWIVARSRSERIPATVREVDISSAMLDGPTSVALSVTVGSKVRSLVRLLDALPVVQPAVYLCPALIENGARVITFSFRASAAGPLLARATYVAYPHLAYDSGPCNAIDLTIAGRRQNPLLGGDFVSRVQRLLSVRLLG
jgi:hypothetical protein